MLNRLSLLSVIILVVALPVRAMDMLAVSASPPVANLNYPTQSMTVFQVINSNAVAMESGVLLTNPFIQGAFANDKLINPKMFNPDVHQLVQASPLRFVMQPRGVQYVRVFLNTKTLPVGDSVLGIYFSAVKSESQVPTRKASKASASGLNMVVGVDINQMSTIYIHHGKGKPNVTMTCNVSYPKGQPAAVNFNFTNNSVWMLRPEFNAIQNGKAVLDKARVAPMMGMTEGTRQLQLPAGVKAPLDITWTSEEGVSGALTCNAAGS